MTQTITITRPDDWHLHVRDGNAMRCVVPHTARQMGRAIIMPNLKPPVTTAAQAVAYRDRIRACVPAGVDFEPLMTLYLTDNTPPDEIRRAREAGVVALKLYPAGRILVMDKDAQRNPESVRRFWGRVATGDWDAAIVPESRFSQLHVSKERRLRNMRARVDEFAHAVEAAAKARGGR